MQTVHANVDACRVCQITDVLTGFVLGDVEESSDVERGVGFVVKVIAWFVKTVGSETVKFFMHVLGDTLRVQHPQGLGKSSKQQCLLFKTINVMNILHITHIHLYLTVLIFRHSKTLPSFIHFFK